VLRDTAGEATGQVLTVKEVIGAAGLREAAPLPQSQETLTDDVDVLMWFQVNGRTVGGGNRALAEFWGCAKGELAGRDITALLWAKTGDRYAEETERVFTGAAAERVKTWNWLVDVAGRRRRFAVTRAPHRRADGSVAYVVCSAAELPRAQRAARSAGRSRAQDETATHVD
jgi:PAS domain S-box-containing protein